MQVEVGVRAVLFDYGRTLVTFDYPAQKLAGVVERFRPAIEAATGRPAPRASEILEKGVYLEHVRLLEKSGGRSGTWKR